MAVVVATRGRARLLPRLVAALAAQQDAPSFDVVLVDDASDDDTWSTIAALEESAAVPVRGVRMPAQAGPAAARNAGWRSASASIVAFTDDDCVPSSGWLRTLVDALAEVDIAQGATLPDPAQRDRLGPFSRTMEVTGPTGYFQTCNVAYRRTVLEQVGGFDDELRQAGEDIELATRALASGATATFCESAVVHHDVRPSDLVEHLKATRRWGGIVLAIRKQPELRQRLHHRLLWKRSHAPALLAAAGVATALSARGPARLLGVAATLPYVRHRLVVEPLAHTRRRQRVLLLPAALISDLTEVGVLAAASARYRELVL